MSPVYPGETAAGVREAIFLLVFGGKLKRLLSKLQLVGVLN